MAKYTLYILAVFLLYSSITFGQTPTPTPLDYECNFNNLDDWQPNIPSQNYWKIGTGTQAQSYNSLDQLDGSYLYINSKDVSNIPKDKNGKNVAYLTQVFNCSNASLPILSFDYYCYFNQETRPALQTPYFEIQVDRGTHEENYHTEFSSIDIQNSEDHWQHQNVCLNAIKAHETVHIRICVYSYSTGDYNIAFDNFKLQNFSFQSITTTPARCFGEYNGAIEITANGGGPDYQFSIDNGLTWTDVITNPTYKFENIKNNSYTLALKDVNAGCQLNNEPVRVDAPGEILVTAQSTQIKCFDQNDAEIEIIEVTENGNPKYPPYQYSLDNGTTWQDEPKFTNLSGGEYSLLVKNSNNCLSEPEKVEIGRDVWMEITNITTTNVEGCYGDNTGSITVDADVYNTPIKYSFNDDDPFRESLPTKDGLSAGNYKIRIQDSQNCILEYPELITITQPDQLQYNGYTKTDVTGCYGNDNGVIEINIPSGGSNDYQYCIDGLNYYYVPERRFENLTGDLTYQISIIDSHGCKISGESVTLNQPPQLKITNVDRTDVNTCYGDKTGSITIQANGGTAPLQYSILTERNDFQTNNTFAVGVGEYYPKVVDNNGCVAEIVEESIIITQPTQVTSEYAYSVEDMIKCNGDNTGMLSARVSGGIPPYKYSIDNFATEKEAQASTACNFQNLTAGTYTLRVKDTKNCQIDPIEINISQPESIQLFIDENSPASCYDAKDATVELRAQGGTPGYSYAYARSGESFFYTQSDNVFKLLANTYDFKITDNNDCSVTVYNIDVTQPTKLFATTTPFDITTCFGDETGHIQVIPSGGVSPYSIYLNNQANENPSDGMFNNLSGGAYTVKVLDANQCEYTISDVYVRQPDKLEITNLLYNNIEGCKGDALGNISYTVSGGTGTLNYSIDGITFTPMPSPVFDNLPAGKYKAMVVDSKGCHDETAEFELTEPEQLEITKIETTDASCYGFYDGGAIVTVKGGQVVQVNYPYHFYFDGDDDPVNYNGEFNNLPAGNYAIHVTDLYNCTVYGNFEISEPNELKFTRTDVTDVTTCYGDRTGTAKLEVSGGVAPITFSAHGFNFIEENETGLFVKMPATVYEFTATDANNCSIQNTATITQPEQISYTAKITKDLKCHGDTDASIEVSATGGTQPYKFSFDNGKTYPYTESSYQNIKQGTYYVKAIDANGCTQQYSFQLDIAEPPQLAADYEKYDVACHSGNTGRILASASGGTKPYKFSIDEINWQYSAGVFKDLSDGNYTVTVTDVNNCMVKIPDIIITRPPNSAGFSLSQTEGCSPLQVTFTQDNSGGFTNYAISNGDKLYDRTGPTTYTFDNHSGTTKTYTITAAMRMPSGVGCTDTATAQVTVYSQPVTDVRFVYDSIVYPETTAYFANMSQGVISAHWDFDDGTTSDNITEDSHTYQHCGRYNIILIQSNGTCYDTLQHPFVIEGRPVLASMKANNIEGCQPVLVDFSNTSSNSDSCVWNFGDGTTSNAEKVTHLYEGSGDYVVTLTAYGDCGAASTSTKTIHVYPKPSAAFVQNTDTLYEGQILRLESDSQGCDYYYWDFGDGNTSTEKNPRHPYEFGGTFDISLMVTSTNSCTDTVKVSQAVTVITNPIVVFPNAFTPNGDGINDVFKPIHGEVASYKISIFNSKGQIMYKGTDIDEGWDGTRNGHPCPTGVYVYKANIVLRDNSFYDLKGYIVLLKLAVKK